MRTLTLIVVLALASTASAQSHVVSEFDSLPTGENFFAGGSWGQPDQFALSNGVLSITAVSGGNPDDSGYFAYAGISPVDASQFLYVNVGAQIGAGNASSGFIVNFFDSQGSGALTATFSAADFNSATFTVAPAQLSAHPEGGIVSDITSFGIAGVGTSVAFRFSFDSIALSSSAIPEPSTYAALLALAALGFVAYRRRFAVAA